MLSHLRTRLSRGRSSPHPRHRLKLCNNQLRRDQRLTRLSHDQRRQIQQDNRRSCRPDPRPLAQAYLGPRHPYRRTTCPHAPPLRLSRRRPSSSSPSARRSRSSSPPHSPLSGSDTGCGRARRLLSTPRARMQRLESLSSRLPENASPRLLRSLRGVSRCRGARRERIPRLSLCSGRETRAVVIRIGGLIKRALNIATAGRTSLQHSHIRTLGIDSVDLGHWT